MAEGGCHCGAVRYEAEGEPLRKAVCHCADCRRHAGAPVVGWTIWPADKVRLTKGEPAVYVSSAHGRRYFCAACGTGLYYTNDEVMDGKTDIQTATLDDPDAFPPTMQVQAAERIGWMETLHELPAYPRWSPDPGEA